MKLQKGTFLSDEFNFVTLAQLCDAYCDANFRLPGASNQKCVHRFLFQIAEHYKEQRKAIDFVVDLLEIDVPELFTVRMTVSGDEFQKDKGAVSEFKRELQVFIFQNALKHKLLSNLREILVRNDFVCVCACVCVCVCGVCVCVCIVCVVM